MFKGLFKSLDEKIEDDKKKLVSKLRSSDIRTLILEMDNNKALSENVVKKQRKEMTFSGADTVSWFAYRECDKLNDINLKEPLIKLLDDKEFSNYKKYVLTCLSSLCSNTNDYDLFEVLVYQLKQADKEDFITPVLQTEKNEKT